MTTFKSERHRPSIAGRIAVLDDLRSGSVTLTTGRCAKPLCHRPGHPGHGPNPRPTYKVNGESVIAALPAPAAIRKAEREIAEIRKLQIPHKEFISVNARIRQVRSSEDVSPATQGKNGGRISKGSLARKRPRVARRFRQPPQDRPHRSGSDTSGHASGWRGGSDPIPLPPPGSEPLRVPAASRLTSGNYGPRRYSPPSALSIIDPGIMRCSAYPLDSPGLCGVQARPWQR